MRARSGQAAAPDVSSSAVRDKSRTSDTLSEKERMMASAAAADAHEVPHRAAPAITRTELFIMGILTFIALIVRFYHLERPSSVVYVRLPLTQFLGLTKCILAGLRRSIFCISFLLMCTRRSESC